jgi:hypothetical protein
VLRPISKLFQRRATLSIAANGIALKTVDQETHVLTLADFQWQQPSQLKAILMAHQALLRQQVVDVVLSNTLVRYAVLPWQEGVLKSNDWQAIAQHAFRSQYGAVAQQWHVSVELGGFGRPILAAAIEQSLFETLMQSAVEYDFSVNSITPLLPLLRSQYPHDATQWALIAEPARLLLCQFKQGDWWQVQVDVPATGQEYTQAEQLIARSLLPIKPSEQPSKIASYVSPSLNSHWQAHSSHMQKMMLNHRTTASHAAWLASLPIPKQVLTFMHNSRPQADLLSALALVISLVLFGMLTVSYQSAQQTKQALLAQSNQAFLQPTRRAPNAQMDTQLLFAKQAQQELNTPWMSMLAGLEDVNQQNKDITVLQIKPNRARAEINIKAETNTFSHITTYLESLRKNPTFVDAALTSQHLEQMADGKQASSEPIYVFEVNVRWQP